jgi:hypothetical protein
MKREEKMPKGLIALVAFRGHANPDPAAAAAALREAGYEVLMMPEKFRSRLYHPRQDFLEVKKCIIGDESKINKMMHDADTIVDRYGGVCGEFREIDEDHVPFSWLWTLLECRDAGLKTRKDLGEVGAEVEQGKEERNGE